MLYRYIFNYILLLLFYYIYIFIILYYYYYYFIIYIFYYSILLLTRLLGIIYLLNIIMKVLFKEIGRERVDMK